MCHRTCISKFSSSNTDEIFFSIESQKGFDLEKTLLDITGRYKEIMQQENITPETEVYLRFHLSDISNQTSKLRYLLSEIEKRSFVSLVGQIPAWGGKITLEGYHVKIHGKGPCKVKVSPDMLVMHHGKYSSLWVKNKPHHPASSFEQTQQIFDKLKEQIYPYKATLENNIFRNWVYMRDIDNNYQGMVEARKALFEEVGLTKGTNYIASTGIEGLAENPSDLVMMDSLGIVGLDPGQITYMNAPDYLCPTFNYNVTFERGTRIIYGDRSHYYISGTASINAKGETLHIGNVCKQTERAIINIQALLNAYDSTLDDLKFAVVYLRDPSDVSIVEEILKDVFLQQTTWIIVVGAVCRHQWLIEIEGIAVSSHGNNIYEPFCKGV